MAGPHAQQSFRQNPLPVGEDELAGATLRAFINNNGTPSHILAVSHISTPAPAPSPTPAKLVAKYTNSDLQRATKLALHLFVQGQQQVQSQIAPPVPEPWKRPLKASFPDLYYNNSHMDCYRFCQQCEDHFKTVSVKGLNRFLFATLFLRGLVTQQWLQHKQRYDGAAPITWQEFKNFFQKNLADIKAFVDYIWSKIKRDSQYQDKSVHDWAVYFKYLQSILIKFVLDYAPEEDTMIWYFQEGLQPSVQFEIEQRGQELDSFEGIVKKAVDAEAKAALRPHSYARNINQHCLWGSRPSAAKTNTQGQLMKDARIEEPKPKSQEQKASPLQRSDSTETFEQAWNEKMKKKEK